MNNTTTAIYFANISDLMTKTAKCKVYIQLSNGYFIPAKKKDLTTLASTMNRSGDKFCGQITFMPHNNDVQIKLQNN